MSNEEFQVMVLQQLKGLTEGQNAIIAEQKALAEGQKTLFEGQKALTESQNAIIAEQKALAEGQKTLFEGQKALAESQNAIIAEQRALAEGQKEIRKDLARLEYRMEHEVIDKIRALFDARAVHEDYFKRINARLDNIEIDTRYLVARVTRLEQLAK